MFIEVPLSKFISGNLLDLSFEQVLEQVFSSVLSPEISNYLKLFLHNQTKDKQFSGLSRFPLDLKTGLQYLMLTPLRQVLSLNHLPSNVSLRSLVDKILTLPLPSPPIYYYDTEALIKPEEIIPHHDVSISLKKSQRISKQTVQEKLRLLQDMAKQGRDVNQEASKLYF